MEIRDLAEKILMEFEHLENMLEIMELGFEYCKHGDNKCEASSIYIIKEYLKNIHEKYVDKLMEELDKTNSSINNSEENNNNLTES